MQPEEGKRLIGGPLNHVYETLSGVQYQLLYCPECQVIFKQVVEKYSEHEQGRYAYSSGFSGRH